MKRIIFGAGYLGKKALEFYGIENIDYIVDNDARKWGIENIDGKKIFSPLKLKEENIKSLIVAVQNGREEVLRQLNSYGVNYEIFEELMMNKISDAIKCIEVMKVENIILCGAKENGKVFKKEIENHHIENINISLVEKENLSSEVETQLVIMVDSYMHAYNYQIVRASLPKNVPVIDLYAPILLSECESLIDNTYKKRELFNDEHIWIEQNKEFVFRKEINKIVELMDITQPLFSHVEIETINRCNMTCEFCPANRNVDKRKFRKMDDKLFRKIIDDLSRMDYSGDIAIFSNNEPLLDERIVEFNKYAKEKLPNAYLYMLTNGTLLTVEKYIELINILDELIIDNYNESLELIKPMQEIREYIGNNEELIRKTTIVIRNPKEILTTRGGDSPNRKIKIKQDNTSCLAPFQQLIIRPDGKVSLCCNDVLGKYTMGDMNESSVEDVWYSKEFIEVRKKIIKGRNKVPHCQFCDTYLWQWVREKKLF